MSAFEQIMLWFCVVGTIRNMRDIYKLADKDK